MIINNEHKTAKSLDTIIKNDSKLHKALCSIIYYCNIVNPSNREHMTKESKQFIIRLWFFKNYLNLDEVEKHCGLPVGMLKQMLDNPDEANPVYVLQLMRGLHDVTNPWSRILSKHAERDASFLYETELF